MIKYIAFGIFWVGVLLIVGMLCHSAFATTEQQVVTLNIQNTFPISVVLEAKCDIVPGTFNKYRFYRRITVPKNGKFSLRVPSNLKSCEIWTIDYELFK